MANHEARIVAHNLAVDLGRIAAAPRTTTTGPVPHAVFGHPQVAAFGPTAAELEAAGTPFVTATQSFGDVAYGWALEDTTGLLTVHADLSGRVLAAHAIGPHASTLIQPLIQAATFGQHATTSRAGSTGSTPPSPRSSRTPCSACRSPDPVLTGRPPAMPGRRRVGLRSVRQ